MAITINNECINFGNYCMCIADDGLCVSGVFCVASCAVATPNVMGETNGYHLKCDQLKFSFASDEQCATCTAALLCDHVGGGQSGTTSGTFGYFNGGNPSPAPNRVTVGTNIEKFPFATDSTGTDVGDLTQSRCQASGASSTTHGYALGGKYLTTVDKHSFSVDGNATDVGDLTAGHYAAQGFSSNFKGYRAGQGNTFANGGDDDHIDAVPFASDVNGVCVGALTCKRNAAAGHTSETHGYISGGRCYSPGPTQCFYNVIDKMPFVSEGAATDVGDLNACVFRTAGNSSTQCGYVFGGSSPPGALAATAYAFPFASDTNSTNLGNLCCNGTLYTEEYLGAVAD